MASIKTASQVISSLDQLAAAIQQTNAFFLKKVHQQVNTALTLRNWIIGFYLVQYEQQGKDRAAYGQQMYKEIAGNLKVKGIKSLAERNLYLCKDFYLAYPQILQTATAKSYLKEFAFFKILQTVSAKFLPASKTAYSNNIDVLISKLSFSHFIELIQADNLLARNFYEAHAIKNTWSVRELKRSINSMLFERTGLSTNKKAVLENYNADIELQPEDVFRDPYFLEFLGLEEKFSYSETDLEEAIISHLQSFLLEMGRGFCFEARQRRITLGNKHYKIDLVFYHRILKCHVLIDLKIGEFDHTDAGQMNMYSNYYADNEMQQTDKNPIGIILCAGKNDTLVKYSVGGLSEKIFVSKYMINLPSEKELKKIIQAEQEKIR